MTNFLLETSLLLLAFFLAGCVLGCILRRMFGAEETALPVESRSVPRPVEPAPAQRRTETQALAPAQTQPRPQVAAPGHASPNLSQPRKPTMILDPASMDSLNRYKVLIGSIVPRPIALVSTLSLDGVRNLAPFSFFQAVGKSPPTVIVILPAPTDLTTPTVSERPTSPRSRPWPSTGPATARMTITRANQLRFNNANFDMAVLLFDDSVASTQQ